MKHNHCAAYKNILLRPLIHEDIESLRNWRNKTDETRFLRQIGQITPDMQENWFKNYLDNPRDVTFAIVETEELNRLVGSVAIYNIFGDIAEFGKIQIGDSAAHGKGIGRIATVMVLLIGFKKLGLKKIVGCVHRENIAAYRNYMKIGFAIVGEHESAVGGIEDEIEINLNTLLSVNDFASEIRLG